MLTDDDVIAEEITIRELSQYTRFKMYGKKLFRLNWNKGIFWSPSGSINKVFRYIPLYSASILLYLKIIKCTYNNSTLFLGGVPKGLG